MKKVKVNFEAISERGEQVEFFHVFDLEESDDYLEEVDLIDKSFLMDKHELCMIIDYNIESVINQYCFKKMHVYGVVRPNGQIESEIIENFRGDLPYHESRFGYNRATRNFRWNPFRGLHFTVGRGDLTDEDIYNINTHIAKRLQLPQNDRGFVVYENQEQEKEVYQYL